jgi:ADP-ribose pyrophosphatase YjhB (NUDIX family)
MSFMRLGTRVAVINDKNEILLSKRGDFGTWALPGGRVDSGELMQDCAVREVYEETGLQVVIERAVGLYYQQGRSRTDVLYRAAPIGGELFSKTDETLENRFFATDNLPEIPFGKFYIDHAYTDKTYLYTIETPCLELLKLDLQLRWRWLKNLLAGRPEPKFPQFTINAVGILFNQRRNQVIAYDDKLLREISNGNIPIQENLRSVYPLQMNWEWVGLYQNPQTDTIDFVFMAIEHAVSSMWKNPSDLTSVHERKYVELSVKQRKGVWLLTQEDFNE